MYIIKNALRCIGRSLGRNLLIGIIVLVIAVSACIGLSIRQAARNAKENTLDGMRITATIAYDRGAMMEQLGSFDQGDKNGGFDRDQFADKMGTISSLTLEEYKQYATAPSVEDFYYTLTAYFDGSDTLSPVTDDTSSSNDSPEFPGGGGMMGGRFTNNGDFTVIGYSSDESMTAFIDGTSSVLEGGNIFEEGTTDLHCVISQELAIYNQLAVGDTVILTNPSLDTEAYTLTICGIYESSETNDFSMSKFGAGQDPANRLYMSAPALQTILDASKDVSVTVTDSTTGRESESAVNGTLTATYVFADADTYAAFENEARALGLDESYAISSTDVAAFENRLTPLNTLSTMAGWFLVVILLIGGIILIVLNVFNVRERKYEVGVLTAMGMKKRKVAAQFLCEILVVTMLAVGIGAMIGAASSVPVTNALLENQIANQNSQQQQLDANFGRPGNMGGNRPSDAPDVPGGKGGMFNDMFGGAVDYITEVDAAVNLTVVFQMMGIGLLLAIVAGAASVLFIMRYDPLKILANRD